MRLLTATLFLVILATASVAAAGSYVGYSDTGFTQTSKRHCCDAAILGAQDSSAANCERAGGYPDYRRSASRGKCKWDRRQDPRGSWIYRCNGTATVRCG